VLRADRCEPLTCADPGERVAVPYIEEEKMKRVVLLGAIVAIALYASGAWSAPSQTPTERKLQKDVASLKAQVKTLKKSITTTQNIAVGIGLIGACNTAITADGLQGTWQVLDQLSAATQSGKTYFGSQSPVNDSIGTQHICAAIGVARGQALPPTAVPFSWLLALYQRAAKASRLDLASVEGSMR
jgi:hypothetical protein